MAVEIVGSEEAVRRYREKLHKEGTYTKRFAKEIADGVIAERPDDYRVATCKFKMVATKDSATDEPEDRIVIVGVANENAVDRMDERLEPSGVDTENFKKNPVLLVDHLYMTRAVVGAVTNVTPEDDGVKFTAELARMTDEGLTAAQKETRILVKQGLIGTVSVGFIPLKIRAPEYDNEGRLLEPPVILQWELLEISIVAIPANAGSTFEMKDLVRRLSFLEDSSYVTKAKDGNRLTSGEVGTKINTQSKTTGEGMEELKDLLAEILGLVKTQAEMAKSQNEILKDLVSKGTEDKEEEEEEETEEEEEEEEKTSDEDEEEEDEDEKALEELRAAVGQNSKSIEDIAKVLQSLIDKG